MNRIDVGIEFSYQGETHHPRASIDLDAMMQSQGRLPDLHRYLAKQAGVDTYSYLYEVMESHPLSFSNAQGLAASFLIDGQFDLAGFEEQWHRQQQTTALAAIAHQYMDIDDLSTHPQLQQALLAAYQLGRGESEDSTPP